MNVFPNEMPHLLESRPHGSIAVHRGPFNFAFDSECLSPVFIGTSSSSSTVPRSQKVLTRNSQQPLAVDLEFDATATWQYAIDPATLQFHTTSPTSLPSPIFDSGKSPLSITVTACRIDWAIAGDTFAAPPPTNPACTGGNTTLTLTPLGVSF